MTDKTKMPWSDPDWRESKTLARFREFVLGKTQKFKEVYRVSPTSEGRMIQDANGYYVRYSDYEKLLKEFTSAQYKLARAGEHMKVAVKED